MASFKNPTFQERTALAQQARQRALEQLRSRPPVDETLVAEKIAAQRARDEAAADARRVKLEAREKEKEEKRLLAQMIAEEAAAIAAAEEAEREAALAAKRAKQPPVLSEAEKKAARDARYAARKMRKK